MFLRIFSRSATISANDELRSSDILRRAKEEAPILRGVSPSRSPYVYPRRNAASGCFCRPSGLKFSGASHFSNASFAHGDSVSRMEYHAVSRFCPLTIMCCRKIPSKVNPSRKSARRDSSFQRVAFPLVAPVLQIFKRVPHHDLHGFCRPAHALQKRRRPAGVNV